MTEKSSCTHCDWALLFAAAAWILVLSLGGGVDRLLERETVSAASLQQQEEADAAVLASYAQMEESLREESRGLAAARTTALVQGGRQAAGIPGTQNISSGDSTELPSAGFTTNAYGRPLVATKKGGSFKASAYNGVTGAGNIPSYRSVNSDVSAWLRIPGTNINYPVMHSSMGDHYYSNLTWQGAPHYYGCIWTPTATTFGTGDTLPANTVLYGHNWNNAINQVRAANFSPAKYIMFAALTNYHYTDWAAQYPYIYYSTPSEQMAFVIFACFYTEGTDWYIQSNPGNLAGVISEAQSRSRHIFGVDVGAGDKILTLSTCTRFYGNTSNQRFVVMARLMRPGEEIGPISVSYNPNHRQPNVW